MSGLARPGTSGLEIRYSAALPNRVHSQAHAEVGLTMAMTSPSWLRRLFAPRARPVTLSILAVAAHWLITVPKGDFETHAPKPAKPKSPAAVQAAKRNQVRSATKLRLLRKTWNGRALADEPRFEKFARRHEGALRTGVQRWLRDYRKQVSSSPRLDDTYECRTVRCSATFCGEVQLIDPLVESFRATRVGAKPVFTSLRSVPANSAKASAKPEDSDQECRAFEFGFLRDLKPGESLGLARSETPAAGKAATDSEAPAPKPTK